MRRILLLVIAGALVVATLAATAGAAFAKINPCPPQQQPTGDLTVCERGGEGGPGGGSGGQLEASLDLDPGLHVSSDQRGGGGGQGGGGGGTSTQDGNPLLGDGQFEVAGGNSETGGGHCGATFEDFEQTGGFEHGKSCNF